MHQSADTVFAAFHATASAYPENAFWCAPAHGAVELSYGAALDEVQRLAAAYRVQGWGSGQRVALLLENRSECMLHFLALNAVGASAVPLNPDYRQTELDYVLGHSEAALVVTLPVHAARFDQFKKKRQCICARGELPSAGGADACSGQPVERW